VEPWCGEEVVEDEVLHVVEECGRGVRMWLRLGIRKGVVRRDRNVVEKIPGLVNMVAGAGGYGSGGRGGGWIW